MAIALGSKAREFKLYAPSAKKVYLAGSFNNWNIKKTAAKKDSKGNWSVKLSLKPGKYEYNYERITSSPHCGCRAPQTIRCCICRLSVSMANVIWVQ